MIRKFGAAFLAMSLLSSTLASAAPVANEGVLAPGKPAGVQQAQGLHSLALWVGGLGIIAGGILLATAGKNGNKITATTTTSTATSTSTSTTP